LQREYLQNSMSCTEEPVRMERYLNDQINSSKVRPQDTILGVTKVAKSNLMWPFIKNNWSLFTDK
jgi:hypothetical protein